MNDTLLYGQLAAIDYREMAERLEEEARTRDFRSMPLTVRTIRQWAFIARNAARAEEQDPEPANTPYRPWEVRP